MTADGPPFISEHDGHTIDVGHVHVLTDHGGPCVPDCPHPDHRTEAERGR